MTRPPASTAAAPGPERTEGPGPAERTQPLTPSSHLAGPRPAGCLNCGLDRGVHDWRCPAVLGPGGGPGGIIRAWELAHQPAEAAGPEAGL